MVVCCFTVLIFLNWLSVVIKLGVMLDPLYTLLNLYIEHKDMCT